MNIKYGDFKTFRAAVSLIKKIIKNRKRKIHIILPSTSPYTIDTEKTAHRNPKIFDGKTEILNMLNGNKLFGQHFDKSLKLNKQGDRYGISNGRVMINNDLCYERKLFKNRNKKYVYTKKFVVTYLHITTTNNIKETSFHREP